MRSLILILAIAQACLGQNTESFPTMPNPKGLQVQMNDDALALGIHHAAINVNITGLLDLSGKPTSGKYAFNERYFAALDRQVKELSDRGALVYVILIAYPSRNPEVDSVVLHPNFRKDYKFSVGGFHTGNGYLEAVVSLMAERWSGGHPEHGRVWGWVIGNEVNSHWVWNNIGPASTAMVADEYEKACRICHQAIRKYSKNARTYLSFDHHWTGRIQNQSTDESTSGRGVLEAFAALARERGDFDWNVAWHPYPEDLFNPRTWLDKAATPDEEAEKVTFRNLQVLPRFLEKPEFLYQGKPRRIILSEQGFHTPAGPDGEKIQAAAYAYAWEKVATLPSIDALILHRHVDHAQEGGLLLGLWTIQPGTVSTPDRKKLSYEVFRKAGTPGWRAAADALLPVTGLKSWAD